MAAPMTIVDHFLDCMEDHKKSCVLDASWSKRNTLAMYALKKLRFYYRLNPSEAQGCDIKKVTRSMLEVAMRNRYKRGTKPTTRHVRFFITELCKKEEDRQEWFKDIQCDNQFAAGQWVSLNSLWGLFNVWLDENNKDATAVKNIELFVKRVATTMLPFKIDYGLHYMQLCLIENKNQGLVPVEDVIG